MLTSVQQEDTTVIQGTAGVSTQPEVSGVPATRATDWWAADVLVREKSPINVSSYQTLDELQISTSALQGLIIAIGGMVVVETLLALLPATATLAIDSLVGEHAQASLR